MSKITSSRKAFKTKKVGIFSFAGCDFSDEDKMVIHVHAEDAPIYTVFALAKLNELIEGDKGIGEITDIVTRPGASNCGMMDLYLRSNFAGNEPKEPKAKQVLSHFIEAFEALAEDLDIDDMLRMNYQSGFNAMAVNSGDVGEVYDFLNP